MAALERIVIKGFKSIKEMDLELRPLNVLIGANGSGKSNFVEVFALLNQLMEARLRLFVSKSGGADVLLHFGQKTTDKIAMVLTFGSFDYHISLQPSANDTLIVGRESLRLYAPDHTQLVEHMITEGLPDSQLLVNDDGMAKQVVSILRESRAYHLRDTSDGAKVKLTGDIHDNNALRSDASNLTAMLSFYQRNRRQDYDRIIRTIQLAAPFLDDFVLRPVPENPDTIMLRWRQKDSDLEWHASHLSDGTLRFICLTTLLMQPDPPPLIIIDEPELGLHPYALNLLAALIKSASVHSQIIVATQSAPL